MLKSKKAKALVATIYSMLKVLCSWLYHQSIKLVGALRLVVIDLRCGHALRCGQFSVITLEFVDGMYEATIPGIATSIGLTPSDAILTVIAINRKAAA